MSAGIVRYDHGEQSLEVNGLRLYLAITLPLTVITFLAWMALYRFTKREDHSVNQLETERGRKQ